MLATLGLAIVAESCSKTLFKETLNFPSAHRDFARAGTRTHTLCCCARYLKRSINENKRSGNMLSAIVGEGVLPTHDNGASNLTQGSADCL